MSKTQIHAPDWYDLDWSEWRVLDPDAVKNLPDSGGIYRIRHRLESREWLEYIGETGRLHGRLYNLESALHREPEMMPYRVPHTAGPCLWAIEKEYGRGLEFSYAAPDSFDDKQYRKGVEAALIAIHRREMGKSPTANFARMIPGYKQSTYKSVENPYRGGPLEEGETEPNADPGVGPLEWENTDAVTSPNWMGLDWSQPYRLHERLDASPPDNGVYRIWYEGEVPPLAYIGESSNISSRLYNHEKTYGGNAFFAFVGDPELNASHKRKEVETDLIGSHVVSFGEPPFTQFGYTDKIPDH